MAWKLTDNFKGRFNRVGHKGKKREDHPCWKGGRIIDRDGYIRVWAPEHPWPRKGYMMEHVRIIEMQIGRRVTPSECVHHKDHDRKNNDPSNLELMSRSEHSKMHRSEIDSYPKDEKGKFKSWRGSISNA